MFEAQDIDKWFEVRWAKLTASEDYKLFAPVKPNEKWGAGAITYIEQKAIEAVSVMWERPELEEVKSLLHGKVHEFPAFEDYVKQTRNTSMTYLGSDNPIFIEHEKFKEESGGTPDVVNILKDGSIDMGVEIKCPRNPLYHFRRLKWKDQYDLKSGYFSCYVQIQKLMLMTGAKEWHFASFDDRQRYQSKKTKIIQVFPDTNLQNALEIKIEMAIREKYKLISEHYEVDVKNKSDFSKIK
jgi:hypothetical protein